MTIEQLGTGARFDAAVQAAHDANTAAEGEHAALAAAAVADLPANQVAADPDPMGGVEDGNSAGS